MMRVKRLALVWLAFGFACGGGEAGPSDQRVAVPPGSTHASAKSGDTGGSEDQKGPDGRGVVRLLPAGHDATHGDVEVVFTPALRQQGLMYRKELPESSGMLFLFERERQLSFWMRNTYLPLDMVFIRADRIVLGVVENAEPLTEDTRMVPGVSQFVLEVNAGYCRRHGIGEGTRVEFIDVEDELKAMAKLGL